MKPSMKDRRNKNLAQLVLEADIANVFFELGQVVAVGGVEHLKIRDLLVHALRRRHALHLVVELSDVRAHLQQQNTNNESENKKKRKSKGKSGSKRLT